MPSAKHVPQPDAAVIDSGVALLEGGASLALGLKPKLGAASIVGFLAAVTPTIHNFWRDDHPGERMHNMADFSKESRAAQRRSSIGR
jgi:putative oxidoreductase